MPGRRTKKPGAPPEDPRDLAVIEGLTLEEIAKRLRGFRGCSIGQLRRRSAEEKWKGQRDEWETKARRKKDEKTADTEATHRAKQLSRFRKIESAAESALSKLLPRIRKGQRLLGDKQGALAGVTELTRTLALTRESIAKLSDTRDDRFTELLDAASRMAEGKIDDVEDYNTDADVLEAMTPKIPAGLEYLRFKLGTGTADTGETPKPPAAAPAPAETEPAA